MEKKNGKGELFMKNQFKYNGNFNNDLKEGKGREENLKDGSIYEGYFLKGLKMEKENYYFKTELVILEILKKENIMVMVLLNILMGKVMKEILKIINYMEMEFLIGAMEGFLLEIMLIIKKMVLENLNGMIIIFMKVIGLIINNMEMEFIILMEKKLKEFLDLGKLL